MKMKKEFSLLDVFCIATGAMISSGLFILPGLAHAQAGPAVTVSYLIGGLLALTGVFSIAELTTAMPRAGGDYFFIMRSMGAAVGTISGLLSWLALSLKSAFALIGMAEFASRLIPVNLQVLAVCLCVVFVVLNLISAKDAGRLQVGLVTGLLALLLLYIVFGFKKVDMHAYVPFAPHGWIAVFATTGFVFVSYGGLLKIACIAEETQNPGRNIPLGMILSLIIVTLIYLLIVFITSGIVDSVQLGSTLTPISDGAHNSMGFKGVVALDIAAMLAFITTANAGIMAASRYPLALSRDQLMPEFLGRIHSKFKTPYISVLMTGLVMTLFLLMRLEILVKTASTVLILTYILSSLSVIILRQSGIQNYQPKFRAPLYPWPQIIGIIGFFFLLSKMGVEPLTICILLIAGGFFAYWFYGRIRSTREFALLHLIERLTAKELTSRSLESELKEIINERDDIVKDRFDHIVEQCIVLDIDHHITMKELFTITAQHLSVRLAIAPEVIFNLLEDREHESSTVISQHLAIPHIVVDGEKVFDVILLRCSDGISFPNEPEPVKAVFVLAGTRDERNFHLRALAAIAQIVQNPRFEKKWLAAKSIEDLRDIILLGKRKRHHE